jgi:predicted nucleic acid-binding Zn ribbon protein
MAAANEDHIDAQAAGRVAGMQPRVLRVAAASPAPAANDQRYECDGLHQQAEHDRHPPELGQALEQAS